MEISPNEIEAALPEVPALNGPQDHPQGDEQKSKYDSHGLINVVIIHLVLWEVLKHVHESQWDIGQLGHPQEEYRSILNIWSQSYSTYGGIHAGGMQ